MTVLSSMADKTRKVSFTIKSQDLRCELDQYLLTRVIQDGKEVAKPEAIAVVDGEQVLITNVDQVGVFEVYVQAMAKGSKSPEVLVARFEAENTTDFINYAPMFSEEVKSGPILVIGQRFKEVSFPPFVDLDEDDFTFVITNLEDLPEYIEITYIPEEMNLILNAGKVPENAEQGSFEVEIELTDARLGTSIETININVLGEVDLQFLAPKKKDKKVIAYVEEEEE